MPARNQKPTSAEWVLDQHEFASGRYAKYLDKCKEVEAVFKTGDDDGGWKIGRDTADQLSPTAPQILRPAKPRAIVDKFLTMLAVRAKFGVQVKPKKVGEEEQRKCSLIENWLIGYQDQFQLETQTRVWRDFVYWALLRGRGCLEVRFDPSYLGTDYLPIRTIVDDPTTIFPVWGRNGIGWYTKCYQRWVWDIRQELEEMPGSAVDHMPEFKDSEGKELKDNDEVEVVEYWDKTWCSLVVNGELVWTHEHGYGFVPLAEARLRATPLASADWSAQSVLYPILNTLQNQFILASKMATGVDVGFWPKVLVQSATGLTMIDTASTPPGEVDNVGPDAKLTVVPYSPNYQVLNALMSWLRGDEQLGGIPDIAWGSEPQGLESGFAISQVLAQVQDKVFDEKIALEMASGWHFSHILRLAEQYAGKMDSAKFKVAVSTETYAGYPKASRKPTVIELSADDIDGRHHVEVKITPDIPQERMVKAQLAAAYRAPGTDGTPLLDDVTIRESIIEDEHPDQTARRIRQQMLATQSKVVQETLMLAAEAEWLDENKELVKIAEKRKEFLLNPEKEPTIPASQVQELAMLLAKELHAQMMGEESGLTEAMAIQDAVEAGEMPPEVPLPSTVAPPQGAMQGIPQEGGALPQVMPSQMGMMPQEEMGSPEAIQMMQQRRGRPQNGR